MKNYKIVKKKEKHISCNCQNSIIVDEYFIIKKRFLYFFWITLHKDVFCDNEIVVFRTLKEARKFIDEWDNSQ